MARKQKSPLSGTFLIIFLIISGLSVWSTQKHWREVSSVMPESSITIDVGEMYDISGLNEEGDDSGLFNLKEQILQISERTGEPDSAMNAVVKITSPWAEGYGFFISNRGHILTSKSLVSYKKDDDDPVWKEQQQLKSNLERYKKTIERLEHKLENNRLNERQIMQTEEQLEKKKELADELEEKLDAYDSGIEVVAMDDTVLDIAYVNESDAYDVALLTVEDIRSPSITPVTSWPSKDFFRDLLDQRDKVYTIGNEPDHATTITRSLIFKLSDGENCCYSLQHKDVFDFRATGSPLLNSRGEVLGICNVNGYTGKVVPILTALEEFKTAIGFGQEAY